MRTDKRIEFTGPAGKKSGMGVLASATRAAVDLQPIIRSKADDWTGLFSRWLAGLNRRNAGLHWWAYTSTAKNLLSSQLGNRLFEVLAVHEALERLGHGLEVRGATPGQISAIALLLRERAVRLGGSAYRRRNWRRAASRLLGLVRQFQQCIRVWLGFRLARARSWRELELCLFTYVDAPRRPGVDGYFGRLHQLMEELQPQRKVGYAAYVYAPYLARLRALRASDGDRTFALFGLLTSGDLLWSLFRALKALFPRRDALAGATPLERMLVPLLEESLIEDVAVGGYFHNLLVHRAVRRLVAASEVKTLIYPYENKSLEKALLLGARAGKAGVELVGYQHTSITARHATLRFEPGEAQITPLPDRIVTVGDVTRRYLERHGLYPSGIFVTGCALRQSWDDPLPRERQPAGPPRILLALSSSRNELVEAVAFMRSALEQYPVEVGVRTHPNFPLALLPAQLRSWVSGSATDLSGSDLAGNLSWCDAVVYVSSTVALEALMRGRPAVNLRLSDAIDPDPLLEPVPLAAKVDSVAALARILADWRALSDGDFSARQAETIARMKDYFKPISKEALAQFLPA